MLRPGQCDLSVPCEVGQTSSILTHRHNNRTGGLLCNKTGVPSQGVLLSYPYTAPPPGWGLGVGVKGG